MQLRPELVDEIGMIARASLCLARVVQHGSRVTGSAIGRLEVAVEVPSAQELAVDGTSQRFEFVYELAGKTMQALLQAPMTVR